MNAPAVVVRFSIEGSPEVSIEAHDKGERDRLLDWINSSPELLGLVRAAEGLRADDDVGYRDAAKHRLPGGAYKDMSLAEVAALGSVGERWFVSMLARLSDDDWMRPPIEEFVRDRLPHLWNRYGVWLRAKAAEVA